MNAHDEPRDLLAEWLKLSREVMAAHYPGAEYAALYIFHAEEGVPPTRIALPASASSAADRPD